MMKSPEDHQFQLSVDADLPPPSSMHLVTFKKFTHFLQQMQKPRLSSNWRLLHKEYLISSSDQDR